MDSFLVATPAALRTPAASQPAASIGLPGLTATTLPAGEGVLAPPTDVPVVPGVEAPADPIDVAAEAVSAVYSLVDAEMVLQYRIKPNDGLLNYLQFCSDSISRLQQLTERERALRDIALAVVSAELSQTSIDEVLSPGRSDLTTDLAAKVQAAFDSQQTGVEVVAFEIPMLRPAGSAAEKFEELSIGRQGAAEFVAKADRSVSGTFAYLLGDRARAADVLGAIDEYNAMKAVDAKQGLKTDSPEAAKKRLAIEQMLVRGGGAAAQTIADAERDRWVQLMTRRAQASGVQSQLAAYRASPHLFQQREIMRVWAQMLPGIDKFVLGVDPARVNIDVDLKKINPILDFAGADKDEVSHQ
jgi:regulator of protease activity HflC (stomatin/prohibitin superfamily)